MPDGGAGSGGEQVEVLRWKTTDVLVTRAGLVKALALIASMWMKWMKKTHPASAAPTADRNARITYRNRLTTNAKGGTLPAFQNSRSLKGSRLFDLDPRNTQNIQRPALTGGAFLFRR